jgi:hypothetical protein
MNVISLKPNQAASSGGVVKKVALTTFRFVRAAGTQAKKIPVQLAQSFVDVRDAWVESQPKNV